MRHPFVVGRRYRNRRGEYEVIRLDGPMMVIRYADGETQETDIAGQLRNIPPNSPSGSMIRAPIMDFISRRATKG